MLTKDVINDMIKKGGGDGIKLPFDFILNNFMQEGDNTHISNFFSGKEKQIRDRDFDMIRSDVLLDPRNKDLKQIFASDIYNRMKVNSSYAVGKFGSAADGFELDMTKKARNIGVYGKNKIKDQKPHSMLDFKSTKRLLDLKIEEVTQSIYNGLDLMDKEESVIPINISASTGYCSSVNPKYNNAHGMIKKSLELDEWFSNDDYANLYKQLPIKTSGFRKMDYPFYKRDKRVAFYLDKANRLIEGFQTNDNNAYSIRTITLVPALANKIMMLLSKAFQMGKTLEVKKRCEFKRDDIGQKLSDSKKYFLCTDVSSADFSISEEQKYYISTKICDGMFHNDWEYLQYSSPTVGVTNDEFRKKYYFAQRIKGGDRTPSGTGRTFVDNYINFSVNQELNLINLMLIKKNMPDLYEGDYDTKTLQKFKDDLFYLNYGDDGVEGLESKEDVPLFKKILDDNRIVVCEIDPSNAFVGGIVYGSPGKYDFTSRLETLLSKTWEGFEGNGSNHPNRSLFFNGLVGKYEYMMNAPFQNDAVLTEQCFDLVCNTFNINNDIEYLRDKAKIELEIVSKSNTKLAILANLVEVLGLKSINDLYHVVSAEEIRDTRIEGLDEVFLFVDSKKWKDRALNLITKGAKWRDPKLYANTIAA